MDSFLRLVKLLQRTGFIQQCTKNKVTYKNGPPGALLRHNILSSWWEKMVIKSESTYPVNGGGEDLYTFFPEIFEWVDKQVPFSIAKVSACPVTVNNVNNHLQPLVNLDSETRLHFLHVCGQAAIGQTFDQVINKRINWWKEHSGNSSDFTQSNGTGETGNSCLNIQYQFPWGQETIETIHNKGETNLTQLEQESGKSYKYRTGKKLLYPSCIECTTSVEMALSVFLIDAYTETSTPSESGVHKQVLHIHPGFAPFKVALTRQGEKQRQISEVTTYIARELRKSGIQILDTKATCIPLEEQIISYDEIGVPFTVIVNDETIDTGAILLRNRDTTIKETLAINRLIDYVTRHINYSAT